jgi:hypothetical protein
MKAAVQAGSDAHGIFLGQIDQTKYMSSFGGISLVSSRSPQKSSAPDGCPKHTSLIHATAA